MFLRPHSLSGSRGVLEVFLDALVFLGYWMDLKSITGGYLLS